MNIIGVDEVGRGCWAGPLLVVAARQKAVLPIGLNDSKLLSKTKRESLLTAITQACDIGEGWVQPDEIDQYGLSGAMRLGVSRALRLVEANAKDTIIMDGNINYCDPVFSNVQCVIKADALYPIVSAASIYAKVTRDEVMTKAAKDFPDYGFESHVGYGTKKHILALQKFGITPLHRMSYKPVRAYL